MLLKDIRHKELSRWIREMAAMCEPDEIVIIDGSAVQKERLTEQALATGELIKLDQVKYPGCYFHRSNPNDVARTEQVTYICTEEQYQVGPMINWMNSQEAYDQAKELYNSCMRGRTMYVIPFSMGPVGSPFSKIGVQLTDSIYVVLNMLIMTRAGEKVLKVLGYNKEFTRCLHSVAECDPKKRLILHFPHDNTIWSVGSGYGGNALLGKKCLALRIASYQAIQEGWLAEHMLIMGIGDDAGNIFYVAAAFPSACGKTNLAMLIPPEGLHSKRYHIWTVGDDIAWMRINSNGELWAINPEAGMFGVAPGTNSKTNPNAMITIAQNAIFTNVLLTEDNGVWWEDGDGAIPENGTNWQGLPWRPGMVDASGKKILGAHPNSRFTAPITQCPSVSKRVNNPEGVRINAIIFGGRRAKLAPLVYQAYDWEHGVYIGTTMASEVTAAQTHGQGQLRYDPMAMLPFFGYNVADYLANWLEIGQRLSNPPQIFHVNWFGTDDNGKYLWPGFGDNLRVLEWIIRRCEKKLPDNPTAIGFMPRPDELDLTGLNLPAENLTKLLAIDKNLWLPELQAREEFLAKIGNTLPVGIYQQHLKLKERISQL